MPGLISHFQLKSHNLVLGELTPVVTHNEFRSRHGNGNIREGRCSAWSYQSKRYIHEADQCLSAARTMRRELRSTVSEAPNFVPLGPAIFKSVPLTTAKANALPP